MVTASWKCSSETGWAVLLVKEKSKLIEGAVPTARLASMSILRLVLFTTARCSLGTAGASGGSADEKDHSSSSLAGAAWVADAAGLGDERDPSTAKGSCAAGAAFVVDGGGEKAEREDAGG